MIKCSKLLLYVTIAVLLLWIVPWLVNFLNVQQIKSPLIMYSSVIEDFAVLDNTSGEMYRDMKGNKYTEHEFDSILPMFYYRQLIADGRFPSQLHGVELNPRLVQTENFMFRHSPDETNKPVIGLYTLIETLSGRVELELPDDVFRITEERIEFIDINSNSINEEKSAKFTKAMLKKDFVFPAKIIAGNPTTHKDYDEGYLLLDSENKLYHLKRVVGQPYVRKVDIIEGVELRHIFLTEFRNHTILGFMTDKDNKMYTLSSTYEFDKLPVESFDPTTQYLTIFGNLFDWTIRVADEYGDKYYAVDAVDHSLIKSTEWKPESPLTGLLPFELSFTSPKDKMVKARFNIN